jgi:hypothetical protein
MVVGETVLASVAFDGGTANESCWAARISGDGRHVGFVSTASNIVPDDLNGLLDVFVRDLDAGVTTRVSADRLGEDADQGSRISSLSYNGDHVGFWTSATDLVDDDTNGMTDAFVRVLEPPPASTHRVSLTSDGQQANGTSDAVMMSVGARFVAFRSDASNLVLNDTNGHSDVFTHDRWTGLTRRVSTDRFGTEAGDWSGSPYISGDNRFVVFHSYAQSLVDGDTNGWGDVFVAYGPIMLFVDGFESGDTSTWSSASP